tara:strand:- start:111 stop:875 length:765 start_codon:yes stop_codon:yes gene_type:complete
MENIDLHISNWILEYSKKNNINSLVVGISGGIDSALTSSLCAKTGINTKLLIMPILQNEVETIRGINHIESLKQKYSNIDYEKIDLTNIYNKYLDEIPRKFQTKLSLANTRARIRMTTLYMVAGSCKGIVVGTGNKIEDFGVGFFTKYGDGGVDISPIADLTKTEVYEISKKMGINQEILEAEPTDGLWDDGRTDESQLGAKYKELEWAMEYYESNNTNGEILDESQKRILDIYMSHRKNNIHKMQAIPVFRKK